MIDLRLDNSGDLELTEGGDVMPTDSVCQAVRIRLLWFLGEWRLGPEIGFPYLEEVFVKNPNVAKLRHRVRETVMEVDEVTDVKEVELNIDRQNRRGSIAVTFSTDEDTFREEVNIKCRSTD